MGRTSKFFFPVPGRRTSFLPQPFRPDNTDTTESTTTNTRASRSQQPLSKAQRLLGTAGNLNIDSPTRDDEGTWHSYTPSSTRSRSATSPSRMSIEIAESTEDDAEIGGGGVPPIRLNGKASSTLLGRGAWGEMGNEDSRSERPDIRSERSSSTLRSYYDRASTPLAVSQQTSASSARDLALRKGFPPVVSALPHSPLSMPHDDSDDTRDRDSYYPPSHAQLDRPKKKPSRLDLTRLFHKKSKDNNSLRPPSTNPSRAPSVASGLSEGPGNATSPGRRLTKNPPALRQKSSVASPPVGRLLDEKTVQFKTDSTTDDLWDHYEAHTYNDPPPIVVPSPSQSPAPATRPPARSRHETPNETTYPDLRPHTAAASSHNPHDDDAAPQYHPQHQPPSAWRSRDHLTAAAGGPAPWDSTSRVSDSSKTTGTSRRSVFSNSNLQQNSILSLSESSSDDDGEGATSGDTSDSHSISDANKPRSRKGKKGGSAHPNATGARSRQKPKHLRNLDAFPRPRSSTSHPSTKSSSHNDFLAIPSPISPHLNGPWHSPSPPQAPTSGGVMRQPSSASGVSTLRSGSSSRTASTLRNNAPRSRPPRESLPSPVSPVLGGLSIPGGPFGGNGNSNGNGNGEVYGYRHGHANGQDANGAQTQAHSQSAERLMSVTAQEQALLSALRKKRARMRDEILAEGVLEFGSAGTSLGNGMGGGYGMEGGGLAPRSSVRSAATGVSRFSGRSGEGESVVFCLDTPEEEEGYGAFEEEKWRGGREREGEREREREMEREKQREKEREIQREKERERQSFLNALSHNNRNYNHAGAGGGAGEGKVGGRAAVRLSAVGSVGGEGFGW